MLFFIDKKIILLFCVHFFLVGCATNTPEKLGINELEWTSYSQEKQQTLLANYERMTKEHEGVLEKQEVDKKLSDHFLEVNIYGGKVMFPPSFINWQSYQPVHFTIFNGKCHNIEMIQASDSDTKTELSVCFYGNVLYLDSSRYDPSNGEGSVSIYRSPLWLSGFVYNEVNSGGYVRLNNVAVEIKQKDTASLNKNMQP
jgi:hypothetical protein